jgi:transmembrane sensor
MSEDPVDVDEAAARWHLAQNDAAMEWDGFSRWLQADPRNRAAFDAIALLDARIDDALPMLREIIPREADSPVLPQRRQPWRWALAGSGLAAAAALGIALLPGAPVASPTVYHTAQGQVRDIRLADGFSATLAPGSVLSATTRDAPLALDGSATFNVRHDPVHPLVIRTGGYEIRDIGTRFEVAASEGILRVAVSEGSVVVRSLSAGGEVQVAAGEILTALDPRSVPTLSRMAATPSGGWRSGRIVYDDVPLGLVVADIARSTGKPVAIDPLSAKRRFSGVLATGSREEMVGALGELTGLRKRVERDAIRLGDGASH